MREAKRRKKEPRTPTSAERGDALHNAVHTIEAYILQSSPNLREKTFLIENKKVVSVGGVHHEIDIYVTVDPAPGYGAIHIFECKNWNKPIGKNEILVFSEKIDAVHAARGYFVAKAFTRDARAQAKKDGRMTLLHASEHDVKGMEIPNALHSAVIIPRRMALDLRRRGATGPAQTAIDIDSATVILEGAPIVPKDYIVGLADEAMKQDSATVPTHRFPEGLYERSVEFLKTFDSDVFTVNGMDIESFTLSLTYALHVFHPPIVSHFDVESRGRVYTLAPVPLPRGGTFQMKIVETPR
jgi:hypothetical protein